MRFLVDLCVSQRVTEFLRSRGHDVADVSQEGGFATPDPDILDRAAAEGRVVVTADLDFPRLLATNCYRLRSVIVFRLGNPSAAEMTARLEQAIAHHYVALEAGAIVTVDESRARVRLLPIGRGA